jgi:hypothetical protein
MFKRKRKIAPYFDTHPPFNAVTGEYASLTGELGVSPYCVLMQIVAADTYDDYVICRGFDTRILAFIDYEEGNPNKPGISVAKPYGKRKPGHYEIGEIYPALLPTQGNATYTPPSPLEINLRLGQNPGYVDGTPEDGGQPSDLSASLALLYDHNGIAVNWLIIDGGVSDRPEDEDEDPCEDIQPGSYRGFALETIPPGETGQIIVETCDGPLLVNAVNHSNCTFYEGNPITVHVDPCCAVSFTGCGGEDGGGGGEDCCQKTIFVCWNGSIVPWPFWTVPEGVAQCNSGPGSLTGFWWRTTTTEKPTEFCPICINLTGFGSTVWWLQLCVTCNAGAITAKWAYWCSAGFTAPGVLAGSGTFDWSDLCDDADLVITNEFTVAGCAMPPMYASRNSGALTCTEVTPNPDPPSCCNESKSFCINGDSRTMPLDGGDETWDVTGCCPLCTAATVRLRTTCNNGAVTLRVTYICDGESIEVNTNITAICKSDSPVIVPIATPACFLRLTITKTTQPCASCVNCCSETRFFCINGISQEMSLSGASELFLVGPCCDCPSAELALDTSCDLVTGIIRVDWAVSCDSLETQTGTEFITCSTTVINIIANDCLFQVQVSETDIGCLECGDGDTGPSTTGPPV